MRGGFACWVPERGQSEDDGAWVTSCTLHPHRLVAQIYASEEAGFNDNPFDELIVHVQEYANNARKNGPRRFRVTVRTEPVFEAEEIK